ncbi:MAG: phosphate signaling complex protein PhoU [Gammaproteobacteria bacterium]|nr:MAG: phosphate signaling complex protein PhoU [Gammaproteobacteria bacterium]
MSSIPKHISKQFDNELEDVRSRVLAMGGLVERQLENAMQSLSNSDSALAQSVIETEVQVNTMEVSIDEECTRILARRQPTAGDLRLITAVIKTITDLERVGDEAEKIARMAIDLIEQQGSRSYYVGISNLGQLAMTILHDALDAFARMDSGAALATAGMEPKSDEQYGAILRELITYMMEDPRSISSVIDAVWVARSLERIADHSRNICEYVIYLVEGKDVRHISIAQMEQEVRG